jgi:hypothetical protein
LFRIAMRPPNNVYRLPTLQKLLNEFGIVPTYLLTYPVVRDPHAVGILREIFDAGECEIGTHCHPWNTPAAWEPLNKYNSMLCNLPSDSAVRKAATVARSHSGTTLR